VRDPDAAPPAGRYPLRGLRAAVFDEHVAELVGSGRAVDRIGPAKPSEP
jgi:hypothetical protein